MRHDEMIGKVQAVAQLSDRGSAEQATRAVLWTLGERLPSGLAEHAAAQLDPELAGCLRPADGAPGPDGVRGAHGERFDLAVFAARVAARAGRSEDVALRDSAAVLEVLDAAWTPELMDKVTAGLPADIGALLPSGRAQGGPDDAPRG